MSRTPEQINKEAKENLIDYISKNDYDNVEAYMGYFKMHNQPEGLNFELDGGGQSPLAVACNSNKTLDIVKLLLDHDADPNYILKEHNDTALFYAINNIHIPYEMTKYLLDRGANPNIRNIGGDTALMWASEDNHTEIARLLLDRGAVIDVRDINGNTALMWASSQGRIEIVRLLLNHGANPNIRDNDGDTALQRALKDDYKEIVRLLLDYGADPTIVNNKGQSFKDYQKVKKIQKRFREKRTKKRNRAAKRIQSRARGNISRKRLTQKKAWKGTEAFDPVMYGDEDIFEYLQSDHNNFVIQLPNSEKYEALNLNDLLKMKQVDDLYKHLGIREYDTFYECHKYDPNDYQNGSRNVNTTKKFMKIGLAQLPVLVPEWFFGNFRYENLPIPEPRIFKLEKYKVVNALVSNKIYHYLEQLNEIVLHNYQVEVEKAQSEGLPQEEIDMMEPDWPLVSADHCNEKKPIQTYRLVPINENVLMADYLTELDRAAKESSTDELDRRYRQLSRISQEDLDSADRLLPHSVRRRLFDDDDDDNDDDNDDDDDDDDDNDDDDENDELDRRYRTLLSGISQEDLNSADRLLRDQGWISEPHSVRRRLFDDDDEDD